MYARFLLLNVVVETGQEVSSCQAKSLRTVGTKSRLHVVTRGQVY